VRTYNVLRLQHVCPPRILVLLLLPEDKNLCLTQSVEELVLRKCAYWISLGGAAATTNEVSIRLHIPRQNGFSPAALLRLLDEAQRGNGP
jgi:hypothetical protein